MTCKMRFFADFCLALTASQTLIRGSLDSLIHTDGWKAYDGWVDVGYAKHFRVHQGDNELATGHTHINGISFWAYAK